MSKQEEEPGKLRVLLCLFVVVLCVFEERVSRSSEGKGECYSPCARSAAARPQLITVFPTFTAGTRARPHLIAALLTEFREKTKLLDEKTMH